MSGLKPGLHQRLPDFRQLLERGAKQVNTLPAGNFAVKAIAFRDLADGDQPVGGHFTRRHPRDDGVRSVLLNIGEKRSLVSCNGRCAGFSRYSFQQEANTDPTSGLQISHPCP